MVDLIIKNARIVNEGSIHEGIILIHQGKIHSIRGRGDEPGPDAIRTIDAEGLFVIPGVIDDQVHFREPGLTHKADIFTESRAAVAGGITSFMEMPNTIPQTITIDDLEDKFSIASEKSLANYSFYLGATNDNISEIRKLDHSQSCGIKIFMGASTGNMLVDKRESLEAIFAESPVLIATHCEDENTIRANSDKYRKQYGEEIPFEYHPLIRSEEACYRSSSLAVDLAIKHNARLHVLHISTSRELELFDSSQTVDRKQITAEVCVHHLWFEQGDYTEKGSLIKWNPAIKTRADRDGLLSGLLNNKLDVIATDHAPHTLEEKGRTYLKAPSGGPLVQHSLPAMMEFVRNGTMELSFLVEKMCHAPARIFKVAGRGFIRKGYFADLVILDPDSPWEVTAHNILYKCGWSPFEGQVFNSRILYTLVNGNIVYRQDHGTGEHIFDESIKGSRLQFNR
jgi:dihydroorotase